MLDKFWIDFVLQEDGSIRKDNKSSSNRIPEVCNLLSELEGTTPVELLAREGPRMPCGVRDAPNPRPAPGKDPKPWSLDVSKDNNSKLMGVLPKIIFDYLQYKLDVKNIETFQKTNQPNNRT